MKLTTRKGKDIYSVLDELMVRMASDEVYDEYIVLRGRMQ